MGPYIDTYTMRPRAACDMGSAAPIAMAENRSKVSVGGYCISPLEMELWASTCINFHVCQGFKENKRFRGVCKLRVTP